MDDADWVYEIARCPGSQLPKLMLQYALWLDGNLQPEKAKQVRSMTTKPEEFRKLWLSPTVDGQVLNLGETKVRTRVVPMGDGG